MHFPRSGPPFSRNRGAGSVRCFTQLSVISTAPQLLQWCRFQSFALLRLASRSSASSCSHSSCPRSTSGPCPRSPDRPVRAPWRVRCDGTSSSVSHRERSRRARSRREECEGIRRRRTPRAARRWGSCFGCQPKLRIGYVVPSERFTVFLPSHKSIPDESCVYRALETGKVETAEETWGVSELPPCRVKTMSMPPGDDAEASLRAAALLTT